MNIARLILFTISIIFINACLSACSTEPMSDAAIAKAEADCQVTGSNIKRRGADCASARRGSGVQDVSPEAMEAAKSKSAGGGVGTKGQ